jgi:hypothetical protein
MSAPRIRRLLADDGNEVLAAIVDRHIASERTDPFKLVFRAGCAEHMTAPSNRAICTAAMPAPELAP